MLTTTRLLLKKQTHNDNAGRWDVPLNWNFQAIDDDIAALALVLTGSTTGAWSVFQGFLDDYTASKSSTLGANATASLNARLNYDQETNLVNDAIITHTCRVPAKRGAYFTDRLTVSPENWWFQNTGANACIVGSASAVQGDNTYLNATGGKQLDVCINGQIYVYNRPITVSKRLNPVGLCIEYHHVYASNCLTAAIIASGKYIDGQTCRQTTAKVYGQGTATIGTSIFTVAVPGGGGGGLSVSNANVGEADWKPLAGNTLEITDGGTVYRYKIVTCAVNDITIQGVFPKTFGASNWVVKDYTQPSFYWLTSTPTVAPSMRILRSSNQMITLGALDHDVSSTSLGYIYSKFSLLAPVSVWHDNKLTYYRSIYGKHVPFAFDAGVDDWAIGETAKEVTADGTFDSYDIFRNVIFFIIAEDVGAGDVVTIYNPMCKPTASAFLVPCFNLANIQTGAHDHLAVGRNLDVNDAANTICRCPTAVNTFEEVTFGDVLGWGFIIGLDI